MTQLLGIRLSSEARKSLEFLAQITAISSYSIKRMAGGAARTSVLISFSEPLLFSRQAGIWVYLQLTRFLRV
ncbi:hypothetical protein WJ71_09555 [Burkholderia ubonensis]|nr:hypothetical protein WJ71_09555 [Burkholderia ubonensis]